MALALKNPESVTVFADKDIRRRAVTFMLMKGYGSPIEYVAEPVVFKPCNPHDGESPPVTFSIGFEEAEALMTALWHCGIRPSSELQSTGQLAAMNEHLKTKDAYIADLRKLLHHQLGIS